MPAEFSAGKIKGPELGISGPALRGLAAGGDSPPRMLLCIEIIVAVRDLLVYNYLSVPAN
jgi:hypothetical protein